MDVVHALAMVMRWWYCGTVGSDQIYDTPASRRVAAGAWHYSASYAHHAVSILPVNNAEASFMESASTCATSC